MSKFYVVATPIGNLGDMTFRAVEVLKKADLILCEDTRTTKRLLDKYSINTKTASYNAHSKTSKKDFIIELLEEGKDIALVSDAGTPCISDPGVLIVSQIREHFKQGEVEIVPIPGASALISALSVSGIPSSEFIFLGFLPHKKGRETLFKEMIESERVMAFYESPHRITKTLESLNKHIPDRKIVIARELTKIYEQTLSGTPEEILQYFNDHPDKLRGEFVVIISSK
jgi:16S rRNA (cytidine1402-2'-O)-methyltransferase